MESDPSPAERAPQPAKRVIFVRHTDGYNTCHFCAHVAVYMRSCPCGLMICNGCVAANVVCPIDSDRISMRLY